MPTTSNFGWTTPADTDLVKDGAAAIRTLGNGIDTSLVDLKGGTTGQILSKASNTDLDYTWIANDQGDITEVSAGTGISVTSGTGPVPVVTNTVATAFDAKGDLVAGTGADTFAKLTVGANNTVLTADSSTATGLKWAAPAGGGKVLQVVYGSTTTITDVSSTTTYADTTLSATITPSATTSKVLILTSQTALVFSQSLLGHGTRILRGSTTIFTGGDRSDGFFDVSGANTPYIGDRFTLAYLDSPSTTSATTYKTQGKLSYGNTVRYQHSNGESTIILMEIGA